MGKKNPRCLRRGSSISMNIYSGSNPVVFLSPEQEEAVESNKLSQIKRKALKEFDKMTISSY